MGRDADSPENGRCAGAGAMPETMPAAKSRVERFVLIAGLCAALIFRVAFVLTTDTPMVSSDGEAYLDVARGMVRVVRSPGVMPDILRELTGAEKSKKSLIAVAERHGMPGIRHFNARLLTYPLFLAFFLLFTKNMLAVALAQAAMGAAACYVAYLWSRKAFGPGAAMAALLISACYPPFIVYCNYIMTEPLCAFLFALLGYWSHGLLFEANRRHGIMAGIALFLLMACRLVYFLLAPAVFAAWLVILLCRGADRGRVRAAMLPPVLAWLVPAIPWFLCMKLVFGGFMPPGLGGMSMNLGQYQEYRGHHQDNRFPPMSARLRGIMEQRGHAEPSEQDYRDEALQMMRERPAGALFLFSEKTQRLWANPHNEFNAGFPISMPWQQVVHRIIILLGMAGLVLSAAVTRRTLLAAALLLYNTIFHALILSIARYNLPLMPVWIFLASFAVARAGFLVRDVLPSSRHKIIFLAGAGLLALYFLHWIPLPVDAPAVYFKALGFLCVAGLSAPVLGFVRARNAALGNPYWKVCAWGVPAVSLAFTLLIIAGNRYNLTWTCALTSENDRVEQAVFLRRPPDVKKAWVAIDVQATPSSLEPLHVTLNNTVIKRAGVPFIVDKNRFHLLMGTYFHYMKYMNLKPNDMRQWYLLPVDTNLIRSENLVSLRWNPGGRKASHLRIWGDFYINKSRRTLVLPYICFTPYESNFLQFIDIQDYRIAQIRGLESKRAISRFSADGKPAAEQDLSRKPGFQGGQYRIRIILQLKDRNRKIY